MGLIWCKNTRGSNVKEISTQQEVHSIRRPLRLLSGRVRGQLRQSLQLHTKPIPSIFYHLIKNKQTKGANHISNIGNKGPKDEFSKMLAFKYILQLMARPTGWISLWDMKENNGDNFGAEKDVYRYLLLSSFQRQQD